MRTDLSIEPILQGIEETTRVRLEVSRLIVNDDRVGMKRYLAKLWQQADDLYPGSQLQTRILREASDGAWWLGIEPPTRRTPVQYFSRYIHDCELNHDPQGMSDLLSYIQSHALDQFEDYRDELLGLIQDARNWLTIP